MSGRAGLSETFTLSSSIHGHPIRQDLAVSLGKLRSLTMADGRKEEGRALADEGLKMLDRLRAADPGNSVIERERRKILATR